VNVAKEENKRKEKKGKKKRPQRKKKEKRKESPHWHTFLAIPFTLLSITHAMHKVKR
jgi:hypothetical protein